MIENALVSVTERKESIPPLVQFQLDPPPVNSMLPGSSLRFTEHGAEFSAEWRPESVHGTDPPAVQEYLDEMLRRCMRDVERYPGSARAHVNLGTIFLNKRDVSNAIAEFERALSLEEGNITALGHLARARTLQGRLDEAKELYSSLLPRCSSDPLPLLGLANVSACSGRWNEAYTLLGRVREQFESSALGQFYSGVVALRLKHQRDAVAHFRKASHLNARWPVAYQGLGIAYLLDGKLRIAEKALRAAHALEPNDPNTVHALAQVLIRLDEKDAATELLIGLLTKSRDDYKSREILAGIYEEQRRYNRAKEQLVSASTAVSTDEEEGSETRARLLHNAGINAALSNDKA